MIRYDKKINQEINRVVKNFNQKIKRLEKLDNQFLPETITKKEIIENVNSRKELKRKLEKLKRFSKRGAEEVITTKSGEKISKYELSELKRETKILKSKLTKEIKSYGEKVPKVFGKKQAVSFSKMGDSYLRSLKSKREYLEKNIENLSKEELKRRKKFIERNIKTQDYYNNIFKDNYIQIIKDLTYFYGYDENKIKILNEKLDKMKPEDFYKLFNEDKSIKSIIDYYQIFISQKNKTDYSEDVHLLFDNLIENIDLIIE